MMNLIEETLSMLNVSTTFLIKKNSNWLISKEKDLLTVIRYWCVFSNEIWRDGWKKEQRCLFFFLRASHQVNTCCSKDQLFDWLCVVNDPFGLETEKIILIMIRCNPEKHSLLVGLPDVEIENTFLLWYLFLAYRGR
jgi:hypothetical protein